MYSLPNPSEGERPFSPLAASPKIRFCRQCCQVVARVHGHFGTAHRKIFHSSTPFSFSPILPSYLFIVLLLKVFPFHSLSLFSLSSSSSPLLIIRFSSSLLSSSSFPPPSILVFFLFFSPLLSSLLVSSHLLRWRRGWGLVWLIYPTAYSFVMISPNLLAIWVFLFLNLSQDLIVLLLRYFGTFLPSPPLLLISFSSAPYPTPLLISSLFSFSYSSFYPFSPSICPGIEKKTKMRKGR